MEVAHAPVDGTSARRTDRFAGAVGRVPLPLGAKLLLGFAFVGLVGNQAYAAALAAAWRGDWQTAQREAARASAWAPWSAEALVVQADAASARGDRPLTAALLRRAVAADPHNDDLWARLATVTEGDEKARALAKAARLNPLGSGSG